MTETKAEEILKILRKTFTLSQRKTSTMDFFETLIAAIISQNTTDKNAARAFENLSKRFEMKPEASSNVEERQVEECLKVAGAIHKKSREPNVQTLPSEVAMSVKDSL